MITERDIIDFLDNENQELNNAWEEKQLGADEEFAVKAPIDHSSVLDATLGFQEVSFRLPVMVITAYKNAAVALGENYKNLMRSVLENFVLNK